MIGGYFCCFEFGIFMLVVCVISSLGEVTLQF